MNVNLRLLLSAAAVGSALICQMGAQTNSAKRAPQPKPVLGPVDPSLIPNHEVTAVTLPGSHFTGAQVQVNGTCKLVSYKVVSDTEIHMELRGARGLDDDQNGCDFTVRTAGGSASSWLAVDLTEDEAQQKSGKDRAAERTKMQAFVEGSGKKWQIRLADGTTETYLAQGADGRGMPMFKSGSKSVSIVVQPDHSVLLIDGQCMRSGQLTDGRVSKGQSMGNCSPAGSWTGTMER